MSVESSLAFLRTAYGSPELTQQLKAVTGTQEIVRLGLRHGYAFDIPELMRASTSFATGASPPAAPARHGAPQGATAGAPGDVLHHEYRLADVPGLDGLIGELPALKIKPIDLAGFDEHFRGEDLRSTALSPADPEYQAWHRAMAATRWRDPALGADAPRRDFHLINLDEHVDHPGYDAYFAAKRRVIDLLEDVFDAEIRMSGSLWYPPSSYRLWHTNETQPGWRMYVIDVDGQPTGPEDTSFFRYMNPRTEEIVTLRESPRTVRFFKAEQEPSRLFWHCIVNPSRRHRWSFGFVVPDDWMDRLARTA